MSNYLNPGNGKFQESLDSKIYVDKTGLIGYTNSVLSTKQKYICVARPRRFGKSVTAEMLMAYYDRGCDSRAQFENLRIAQDPSFEKHLNKYDVFQINIADIINKKVDAETGIAKLERNIRSDLKNAYPDISYEDENDIPSMLKTVYQKTGTKFVFVIDEWDCPMRERKRKKEHDLYLLFLRELFKDKEYIALCYMTGILPVKKSGSNSEANMFDEFTMISPKNLGEYFGFTEDETKAESEKHGVPFEGLKEWYDGYDVGGKSIYNPNSVSNALRYNSLESYWTKTESYENLKTYIKTNKYGVQDVLVDLLAGKEVEVNPDGFANDTVTFDDRDDVLTLLIHLGYLTYDSRTKKARIPNREIRNEFVRVTDSVGLGNYDMTRLNSEKVLEATLKGDENTVAEYVRKIHRMRVSKLEYNKEISLKFAIEFAYLAAEDYYSFVLEMPAGDGFADVGYIPMNCNDHSYPPMIVELKVDKGAEGALGQALDSEYFDFLSAYHGEVILVGINYDTDTKKHTCKIQRVVKE